MALAHWDPWRELTGLRRELERLLESPAGRAPFGRFSFLPGLAARAYPLLRVSDNAEQIRIEALAPGLDVDSLKLSVINNQLRIEGRKQAPEGLQPDNCHRSERSAGAFVRALELPAPIQADKIDADYRNGILSIRMPKAEHARPRRISVNVH